MDPAIVQFWYDPACNRTVGMVRGFLWTDYLDLATFPLIFVACIVGSVMILVITTRRVAWKNDGEWYLKDAIICALAASDLVGM